MELRCCKIFMFFERERVRVLPLNSNKVNRPVWLFRITATRMAREYTIYFQTSRGGKWKKEK